MRIAVTGGGTAGHVTPLKSVIHELKKIDSSIEILFIAQKGDRFADLLDHGSEVDHVHYIQAGKYRRYPDETTMQRILDIETHALNARDVFRTGGAVWASYRVLKQFKPDVVFGNGGYVSVPVGWATSRLNIPLVIHESDARPGIATRLLTSRAHKILSGVPTKTTTMRGKALEYVGIPLRPAFTEPSKDSQAEIKEKLGFDPKKSLVTIAGSSLGAEAINTAVISSIDRLLKTTQVAHITGKDHHAEVAKAIDASGVKEGYEAISFTDHIDQYFKASDVVINRASATVFAELAALGKATILIPAPQLSDQLENARVLLDKGAVQVIEQAPLDDAPELLVNRIEELLGDAKEKARLEKEIKTLAKPDASHKLAEILMTYRGENGSSKE